MNEERIIENYHALEDRLRGVYGDADYVLHELAHFVVLFRRAPRMSKREVEDMQMVLDDMPCGFAQLHELRVIKLQRLVLGYAVKPILKQVMWGIREAAEERARGQKDIVASVTRGLRLLRGIKVSPRLVAAYRRAIKRFSR